MIDVRITYGLGFQDRRDEVYAQYARVMEPLRTLAAMRHVLTREEFDILCLDPLITKYLAYADEGEPHGGRIVGMAVATNYLERVPLIEPEFYRNRYGNAAVDDRRVWYVPFVYVDRDEPGTRDAFPALVRAVAAPIRAARGVGCLDYCEHNIDEVPLFDVSTRIIRREHGPDVGEHIDDSQHFVSWDFRDLP